jgi:hypothetical protein
LVGFGFAAVGFWGALALVAPLLVLIVGTPFFCLPELPFILPLRPVAEPAAPQGANLPFLARHGFFATSARLL